MRPVARVMKANPLYAALLGMIFATNLPYIVGAFFPAKYWLEYRTVYITDAEVGQPVQVTGDRIVWREAPVTFIVVIRNIETGMVECSMPRPSGPFTYAVSWRVEDGEFINRNAGPMRLEKWTDGHCPTRVLPMGLYQATTEWVIERPWPMYPARIVEKSNIFEVRGPRP